MQGMYVCNFECSSCQKETDGMIIFTQHVQNITTPLINIKLLINNHIHFFILRLQNPLCILQLTARLNLE